MTYVVNQILQDTIDTGLRQIRLIAQEADGRWLTQTIVDRLGNQIDSGRRTRVSEITLSTSYALVSDIHGREEISK